MDKKIHTFRLSLALYAFIMQLFDTMAKEHLLVLITNENHVYLWHMM